MHVLRLDNHEYNDSHLYFPNCHITEPCALKKKQTCGKGIKFLVSKCKAVIPISNEIVPVRRQFNVFQAEDIKYNISSSLLVQHFGPIVCLV